MKLHNPLKTHEIGGRSFQFGRLTIGMGVEIEAYLKTLPTQLEQIETSGVLKNVSKETADAIVSEALQKHDVFPPDALVALHTTRFLMNSSFGNVFVRSALRQYNPGLTSDEIDRIAAQATYDDVLHIQRIAAGTDEIDPKELHVADRTEPATN